MNNLFKILIGIVLISMFSVGSVYAQNDMANGPHDLAALVGADLPSGMVSQDLCRFCHTPHNSQVLAPLWDRAASGETFTMYTSPSGTMNGTPGLAGVSGGCMSCHDGSTAFDAVNGYVGTDLKDMNTLFGGSKAILSNDLSNDHPIGMDYVGDAQISGTEPNAPYKIFNSKVECASCHDVHDNTAGWKMLRSDPGNGDICNSCHTK